MSFLSKATAVAQPNIALIKYWGKANDELIIPNTSSLSLTLDIFPTETTVQLLPEAGSDEFFLNGIAQSAESASRVFNFLNLLRERAGNRNSAQNEKPAEKRNQAQNENWTQNGKPAEKTVSSAASELVAGGSKTDYRIRVDSTNTVPTGAGLASSASGFAALAVAGAKAFGLDYTPTELSRLARRGSGSASRSIFSGLAIWHSGSDDESSYAEAIDSQGLDLGMVLVVVNAGEKSISSRVAMKNTIASSPYYPAWVESTKKQLDEMLQAIKTADFEKIGELTESNALRMHASMLAAFPPIRYFQAETVKALELVQQLRSSGILAYATMDAGPNVKVLCQAKDLNQVSQLLAEELPNAAIFSSGQGLGARLVELSQQ